MLIFSVIYIIGEVWRQQSKTEVEKLWDLLGDLYAANTSLSDFSEDRRKFRAAELVVAAWKSNALTHQGHQSKKTQSQMQLYKPPLVGDLETKLAEQTEANKRPIGPTEEQRLRSVQPTSYERTMTTDKRAEPIVHDGDLFSEDWLDLDTLLGQDLNEIDWSFWGSSD